MPYRGGGTALALSMDIEREDKLVKGFPAKLGGRLECRHQWRMGSHFRLSFFDEKNCNLENEGIRTQKSRLLWGSKLEDKRQTHRKLDQWWLIPQISEQREFHQCQF